MNVNHAVLQINLSEGSKRFQSPLKRSELLLPACGHALSSLTTNSLTPLNGGWIAAARNQQTNAASPVYRLPSQWSILLRRRPDRATSAV